MTSFDYRLNPRYPIKECSSCGALYTTDYCCSNGSLVDKIICDLNKAPESPHLHTLSSNQRHCFHCKDMLGDGEICQRCTCTRCRTSLCREFCLICKHNQHSLNTSPSISANSSQSPSQISQHCCYGCGNPLEGIFCHQCTCELCGNGAHYGYNFSPKVPILPDPEPFNSHTIKDLSPTVQGFDPKSDLVHNSPNVFSPSLQPLDYTIAVTPSLPIKEPENSLSMGDEHLDTILATESNEFIKSSIENLVPIPCESEGIPEHICDVPFHDNSPPIDVSKDQFKDFSESNDEFSLTDDDSFSIDNIDYVEGIDNDILLTIKDDILHEKLLNVNLLIAKIEALNDNPTPSSDFKTKSSSTSLNSLLEETNTFDNSLLEFETFWFDVEEISSSSTTTHSDISLLEYEVFYDDHVNEISSGSTTTHSDSPLYESFIFDLLINPFPPADRSDFYEFADELIPFISPPEYDCFLFKIEPNSRDFTMDVVEDISPTKEPRVHNALPTHPTLQLNMKTKNDSVKLEVKEKQENNKIKTKPDKNGKRGKARQCTRPITVKKAGKV
nr:hypothetical protein [Tanacetum cinerariifolium]